MSKYYRQIYSIFTLKMSHEYTNIDSTQEKPTNDSFSKKVRIIVTKVQPFKTLPMDSSVCHPLS